MEAREQFGSVQKFSDFLCSVVLDIVEGAIVIFVDEIDSTLGLPFTDDFFGAIRAMYNGSRQQLRIRAIDLCVVGCSSPI